MKNNSKIISNTMIIKQRIIVTVMLALAFMGMSIGYAVYYAELNINSHVGVSSVKKGTIEDLDIKKIDTVNSSSEAKTEYNKKKTDKGINFNVSIVSDLDFNKWLRYELIVVNNSHLGYTYMGTDASISFKNSNNMDEPIKYPIITGMIKGDVITPGESKKIYISFYADDSNYEKLDETYTLTSNLVLSFAEGIIKDQRPIFLAALEDTEVTLKEKKSDEINFNLTSLFDCSQVLSFYVLDPDFELLVSSGKNTATNFIVNKGANENFLASLKLKSGIEEKRQYKTKLMGKIIYEAEEKEEIFEIGEILITNEN